MIVDRSVLGRDEEGGLSAGPAVIREESCAWDQELVWRRGSELLTACVYNLFSIGKRETLRSFERSRSTHSLDVFPGFQPDLTNEVPF